MALANLSPICLYLATCGYGVSLLLLLRKRGLIENVFFAAFMFHTISQVSRGYIAGVFTHAALVHEVFFLPWCLALLTIVAKFSGYEKRQVYTAVVPVGLFSVFALLYQKDFAHYLISKTVFADLFFLFEVTAHSCFILGAWYALLHLLRKESPDIFHSFIVWGFVSYSAAQITGAVWCYLGWASLFNWSWRHLISATIWCYYSVYIHLRFMPGWDSKKKACFSIMGFFIVFFLHYWGYFGDMNIKWPIG